MEVVISQRIVVATEMLVLVSQFEQGNVPKDDRFIYSKPTCNFITIATEYYTSIVYKISNYLIAEPSSVRVLEV